MSAIQLSFSLRVSSGVRTVHLLGSWDNYAGQLPLSKDRSSSKSGAWKGTFRFQQSTLEPGKRYWYYYIIDGCHVSHNPSEESTVEPTTGRSLNILDVPKSSRSSSSRTSTSKSSSSSSSKHSSRSSKDSSSHRSSHRRSTALTLDVVHGRPLSMSQIKSPKPVSPHATSHLLNGSYDAEADELSARFAATGLYDYGDEDIITDFDDFDVSSPVSSSGSSLSYRSDSSSPSSNMSGYSTPSSDCSACTCERYGITRKGDRVRLDCGGTRCGGFDSDSEFDETCSSSEEDAYVARSARRNGMIVTH